MTFILICLASYRLTRLITADHITEPYRQWIATRAKRANEGLDYFVTCPHCVSAWVCSIVVAVVAQIVSVPLPVLVALAAMGAVSIIAEWIGG